MRQEIHWRLRLASVMDTAHWDSPVWIRITGVDICLCRMRSFPTPCVSVMRLPITIIPTQMSGHGLTSSLLIPCQYQGTCSRKTFRDWDSISDRVFCLSVDEVKNPAYKAITRKIWTPQRGMRYYWTRSPRENTTNQAYMVQYNGHIASSRVSLTEAGVRPAFVIQKGEPDNTQGRIWYTGDTMERSIAGKSYTFRCIDPDYCDAGSNRNGALFLCDTIIGGSESLFDVRANAWEASDLRAWLDQELEDRENLAETVYNLPVYLCGKSNNYQISARSFTKRSRLGIKVTDQIFCLSLEEALRYPDILWRLGGAEENNFINAGTFTTGYWLRTPAAGDGTKGYAVTYDGRVAPEDVTNKKIGIRPAFVVVQE